MAQKNKKKKCSLPHAGVVIPSSARAPIASATATLATLPSSTSAAKTQVARPSKRKHPCIANYGKCRYGEYCVFRDMPANVCMHHYFSRCEFGHKCANLHEIDGRSIERSKQAVTAENGYDCAGLSDEFEEQEQGGVAEMLRYGNNQYMATLVAPNLRIATLCTTTESCQHDVTPNPCQLTDENDHLYNSVVPAAHSNYAEQNATLTRILPTPYRSALLAQSVTQLPTSWDGVCQHTAPVCCEDRPQFTEEAAKDCVVEGECVEAVRSRRRCCRNVYDSHCTTTHHRNTRASRYDGDSLAEFFADKMSHSTPSRQRCVHSNANRTVDTGQAASIPVEDEKSNYNDTDLGTRHDKRSSYDSCDNDNYAMSAHDEETNVSPDTARAHCTSGCSDDELIALMKLIELFPDQDPVNILQALRMHSFERSDSSSSAAEMAAVNTLLEMQSMGDVVCDEALAQALAEDEEEERRIAAAAAAAEQNGMEHDGSSGSSTGMGGVEQRGGCAWPYEESLESLHLLFPDEPISHVAAALQQLDNNYHAAYELLLCATQESVRDGQQEKAEVTQARELASTNSSNMDNDNDNHYNDYASVVRGQSSCNTMSSTHGKLLREAVLHSSQARAQHRVRRHGLLRSSGTMAAAPSVCVRASSPQQHQQGADDTARYMRNRGDGRNGRAVNDTCTTLGSPREGSDVAAIASSEEVLREYRAVEKEVRRFGDWRSVRQAAYRINSMRLRTVDHAKQAFQMGCPAMVQRLNVEARRLEAEYVRLNKIALLALEQERLARDPCSTLDLHDVHTDEVKELLYRRVRMCQRRRVGRLNIVVGEGRHSKGGIAKLAPKVKECLANDAVLQRSATMVSLQPGIIRVRIHAANGPSSSYL